MTTQPSENVDLAATAVLQPSEPLPKGTKIVKGYEFSDEKVDYDALLQTYLTSGFQATHFGQAVNIINDMVRWPSFPSHQKEPIELTFTPIS